MQSRELSDDDFSNLVFYGTFEDMQAMRAAETPYTQTRMIYKPDETGEPGESDYTIKHGPRKQLVLQIHENKAVEQVLSTETEFIYSSMRELKTTVAYVNHGQTIQLIKNTNPHFTCLVGNNNFDHNNTQHMPYQCEDCEKFFFRISEYRKHLVRIVAKICKSCGKRFPNHGKYLLHCNGHGNPDRECSGCQKVLANRYSLKKHMSICKKMLTRKLKEFRKPPNTASN